MNFNDLYGNEELKKNILSLIENDALPHALLLSGMDGIGKFGFARAIAVNLASVLSDKKTEVINEVEDRFEYLDIFYVIPTDIKGKGNNGVFNQSDYFKTISTLKDGKNTGETIPLGYIQFVISQLKYKSVRDSNRTVIIRDAHRMTIEAQNALLKILEEPPEKVFFILTASNEDKLLPTIISRCSRYLMSGLNEREMSPFLSGIDVNARKRALLGILANGSPGTLYKYAEFDIDKIADNLAQSIEKKKFTELVSGIEYALSGKKGNKQVILRLYREILLLILYHNYIGNFDVIDYNLNLNKDRIEKTIDTMIAMEKNSVYNLSWETKWGNIFYKLIGG